MRRATALVLGLFALALAATAGPSVGAPAASAACKPGQRIVNTVRVTTFCGPAQATVRVGTRRWSFSGGKCSRTSGGFLLGIGRYSLTNGAPKYRSFWISAPAARDGTFRAALVQWQVPGITYVFETVTLRIAGKRTRGTFTGKVSGVGRGTGSFSCK